MNHNHKCLKDLNKALEHHNTKLVGNLIGTNAVLIETEKVDSKTRGRPKTVVATFCPFCGKKLVRRSLLK